MAGRRGSREADRRGTTPVEVSMPGQNKVEGGRLRMLLEIKALAHEDRLLIALCLRERGPMHFEDIAELLAEKRGKPSVSRSLLAYHLDVLEQALVERVYERPRRGRRFSRYSLTERGRRLVEALVRLSTIELPAAVEVLTEVEA